LALVIEKAGKGWGWIISRRKTNPKPLPILANHLLMISSSKRPKIRSVFPSAEDRLAFPG
jgi:hypothetical protein